MEREDARRRTLYLAAVALVVLYLAYLSRQAIVPLLVALLLAYLLAPLVAVLERRGFSRMGAVTTLFVLFFGTAGLALVFGVPPLVEQGRALVQAAVGEPGLTLDPSLPAVMKGMPDKRPPATLKEFLEARQDAAGDAGRDPDADLVGYWERKERSLRMAGREQELLEFRRSHEDWKVGRREGRLVAFRDFNRDGHFDAGYVFDGALLAGAWVRQRLRNPSLATALEDMATDALPALAESLFLHGTAVARGALGILGTALTVLGWLVIVPLYTFFFLMRLEDVWAAFVAYLPGTHRDRVLKVLGDVHRMLIGFFRGRITTMFLKGAFVAAGLAFLGVPFWPVWGALAGVLTIVPAVGPILAGAPAVILSYSEDGVLSSGLVLGVLVAAEILEGYILIPKMIGKEVGLHPMAVITAVLVGAALLGLFGVVIAIPLAAAARIVWSEFVLPALRAKAAEAPAPPDKPGRR